MTSIGTNTITGGDGGSKALERCNQARRGLQVAWSVLSVLAQDVVKLILLYHSSCSYVCQSRHTYTTD